MAKKIDVQEEKRKNVRQKLTFIAVIAAFILLTNLYLSLHKETQAEVETESVLTKLNDTKNDVLGTASDSEARDQLINEVSSQIQTTSDYVSTTTQDVITEQKARLEDTFNEIIYTTTVKPIIDRVEGLPGDQQGYIKEVICKEPESSTSANLETEIEIPREN